MAILKYYNTNTSAWEYVAASPTANFTTWKKTATGGETSVSGSDDNSVTLSYTPGLEQVFLNGVLLVRGTDYTATDGTSITGLSALTASDIVSVVCYAPFNVGDAVANTLIDAKGDLLVGTADNTAGRLGVTGPTGSVLVTDAGETTGLKWVDPGTVGGLVHIATRTVSGTSSEIFDGVFSATYDNYSIKAEILSSANNDLNFRLRASGTPDSSTQYTRQEAFFSGSTATVSRPAAASSGRFISSLASSQRAAANFEVFNPFLTQVTAFISQNFSKYSDASNITGVISYLGHNVASSFDGIEFNLASAGTMTGTISIYAYRKS